MNEPPTLTCAGSRSTHCPFSSRCQVASDRGSANTATLTARLSSAAHLFFLGSLAKERRREARSELIRGEPLIRDLVNTGWRGRERLFMRRTPSRAQSSDLTGDLYQSSGVSYQTLHESERIQAAPKTKEVPLPISVELKESGPEPPIE